MLHFSIPPRVQQSSRNGKWHYLHWNKKNLTGMARGKWAEELPTVGVVSQHNYIQATNFTPFRLLYGQEAIILKEI
jgi:hypothetical protein